MIRKIEIEDHNQVFYCDWCGAPVDPNHVYIDTMDDSKIFCCSGCAHDYFATHHFQTSYSPRMYEN